MKSVTWGSVRHSSIDSIIILQIKNHDNRRQIFLPHTSFRTSCSLFSVGDNNEALKLVCGRNKMSSDIVVFNFQFKFEIKLITKIETFLLDLAAICVWIVVLGKVDFYRQK